ncbi:hypothetical protein UY3_09980 [Chelonia mydas]|uniref:Uncharacterized protein n=1 Tax=Chelonia mydas TaxID=8469 RepID=M7B4R5_CHEMY|nr:hypothetical protein UY3_09980 [Chelonia mydas]
MLERTLKAAIHSLYREALKRKLDRGKAFELTSKWDASNHFLAGGSFTRFADGRFIHHARLNCVPLNGASLAAAPQHHPEPPSESHRTALGEVAVNCAIPGTDSQLRPDVVVTDEAQKKIILVDITFSFKNRTPAFREARASKLEKYAPLADTLRAKSYEVQMDALIVGALGAWDPCNEHVLRTCGIGLRYTRLKRCLVVSDIIRWSRD